MRLDLLIDDIHLLLVLGMKITVQGGGGGEGDHNKLVMMKLFWLIHNGLCKERCQQRIGIIFRI